MNLKLLKVSALHHQIANILRKWIQRGKFKPGDQLMSEESLAKYFEVSRATIREALKALEHENYVTTKQGSGTFISKNAVFVNNAINQLRSTTEMMDTAGLELTNKTIALKIELADETVQECLELTDRDYVVQMERIRLIQNESVIYSRDIFPKNVVLDVSKLNHFEGSLFAFFEKNCNVQIKYAEATVSAVEKIKWPVELPNRNTPALLFEQTHYDQHDTPILYSIDYYQSDRFKFHVFRRRDI